MLSDYENICLPIQICHSMCRNATPVWTIEHPQLCFALQMTALVKASFLGSIQSSMEAAELIEKCSGSKCSFHLHVPFARILTIEVSGPGCNIPCVVETDVLLS